MSNEESSRPMTQAEQEHLAKILLDEFTACEFVTREIGEVLQHTNAVQAGMALRVVWNLMRKKHGQVYEMLETVVDDIMRDWDPTTSKFERPN